MPTSPLPAPHAKHAALARPATGEFNRHELAILGAPCGVIKELVARLLPYLTPYLNVAYVDADHATGDAPEAADTLLPAGGAAELTDKIHFRRLDARRPFDRFAQQHWLGGQSLVLVNGNHFRAQQQVAIISSQKPLEKKLDRLIDVSLILLDDGQTELPAYLQAHLVGRQPTVIQLHDTAAVAAWVRQWYQAAAPPLRGLVLAGGRSQRMQTDKGQLRYHGQEQRQYAATLLAEVCEDVFVSCRPDQAAAVAAAGLVPLPDQFLDLGPMGGLLTAFRHDPNAAWLVVACDLPFLSAATLRYLVRHRHAGRLATAFQSPHNEFPEPLITIWEPRSYATLLQFLALGYSCPRKVLINSEIELLTAPAPQELRNVNTPQERAAAEQELK